MHRKLHTFITKRIANMHTFFLLKLVDQHTFFFKCLVTRKHTFLWNNVLSFTSQFDALHIIYVWVRSKHHPIDYDLIIFSAILLTNVDIRHKRKFVHPSKKGIQAAARWTLLRYISCYLLVWTNPRHNNSSFEQKSAAVLVWIDLN